MTNSVSQLVDHTPLPPIHTNVVEAVAQELAAINAEHTTGPAPTWDQLPPFLQADYRRRARRILRVARTHTHANQEQP